MSVIIGGDAAAVDVVFDSTGHMIRDSSLGASGCRLRGRDGSC